MRTLDEDLECEPCMGFPMGTLTEKSDSVVGCASVRNQWRSTPGPVFHQHNSASFEGYDIGRWPKCIAKAIHWKSYCCFER